jgi:hypothetical protein
MAESTRELSPDEQAYVATARTKAFTLYEGVQVAHRSCGIALAETFGVPSRPYQALRRGGITGKGECGAIRAGEQILGELLGDPDPVGAVTPELRAAVTSNNPDIICDHLVRPHGDFAGPARKAFCTNIAADVAALTAEALCRFSAHRPEIAPVELP